MELEFSLGKSDFVTYQLYILSQSEGFKKKRKTNRILPPVYCVIIGILLLIYKGMLFLMIFLIFAALWAAFYPLYSGLYYKLYFFRLIGKKYKARIGLPGRVSIEDKEIRLSDDTGEINIELKDIKEIIEIKSHVFVVFDSGMAIILPKNKIDSFHLGNFVLEIEQLTGITRTDMSGWEWR